MVCVNAYRHDCNLHLFKPKWRDFPCGKQRCGRNKAFLVKRNVTQVTLESEMIIGGCKWEQNLELFIWI